MRLPDAVTEFGKGSRDDATCVSLLNKSRCASKHPIEIGPLRNEPITLVYCPVYTLSVFGQS